MLVNTYLLYKRDNTSLRNICFWDPRLMQDAFQNRANVVLQRYYECRKSKVFLCIRLRVNKVLDTIQELRRFLVNHSTLESDIVY